MKEQKQLLNFVLKVNMCRYLFYEGNIADPYEIIRDFGSNFKTMADAGLALNTQQMDDMIGYCIWELNAIKIPVEWPPNLEHEYGWFLDVEPVLCIWDDFFAGFLHYTDFEKMPETTEVFENIRNREDLEELLEKSFMAFAQGLPTVEDAVITMLS